MNYYNPYLSMYPYMSSAISSAPRLGLFSRLFGGSGINFGTILSGTQKTLNIVNQTIPLVKQAGPVFKNAKTMFRVMNEFKRIDTPKNTVTNDVVNDKTEQVKEEPTSYDGNPTFFA